MIQLQSVDSTNNYAMALVHEGMAQHGTAVLAAEQTQGKGQRGKVWSSQQNQNLLCSIIIQPENSNPVFVFSMAIALAVHHVFNKHAGNESRVKWPNDILWRDRKAGGILIENVYQGTDWKYAIAGIGLNINQTEFPGLEQKAVSLKQITGKNWEIAQLAQELFFAIDQVLEQLKQDPVSIMDAYHHSLYRINETVRLKKDARVFQAHVKGVGADGALIVDTGIEEQFPVGTIEWLT